jgi:glycogen operon protein
MQHAPVLWSIEFSRVLSRTHLIAEAWDAVGLQQLGDFPGFRWSQWNGRFRDVVRRFVRGDEGMRAEMATRLAGSSDLFGAAGGHPVQSVNFVSCHDGFTLYDLLAYAHKHNAANGEDNRDGNNDNLSGNCGVEGPTDDPEIQATRLRRARNFMLTLMLSQGVPMMLAGDERLRTQHGNNNAYCQDNELSWIDWTATREADDMVRFTTLAIALRKRHASLRRSNFIAPSKPGRHSDLQWYGADGNEPDWHVSSSKVLCFALAAAAAGEAQLFVAFNMSAMAVEIALPRSAQGSWRRLADTGLPAPAEIVLPEQAELVVGSSYVLGADSVAVLESG